MTTQYTKPLPQPLNPAPSKEFWEAAQRHELVMPRCSHCGRIFWYPREQCPNPTCFSDARLGKDLGWTSVSGKGVLYSYTVVHQPAVGFESDSPYVVCLVELEEGQGIRMMSNLVDCKLEDIKVGMKVEAAYDDVTDAWTLVKFKPA